MKTKFFIFSTVLAAATLTACTNEDFVESPAGTTDMGGEKVNISIAASKGGDVATRIGINPGEDGSLAGVSPYWQASDMLGGLLYIENASANPSGDNMRTNYPFTPAQEIAEGEQPLTMTFKTPTAVSKGTYVFYTPYKRDFISNGKFEVTLPERQVMDPENPTAHLGANDFMVSPGISLAGIKYGDDNELPIQFSSIYNYTRLNITLKEAQEPVTIQRIVFKVNTATSGLYGTFSTTAQIQPQLLRNAVLGMTNEKWSDGKTISGGTGVITTEGEIDASVAVASDYQQAAAEFKVPQGSLTKIVEQSGSTAAIVLAIDGGVTLNAGESFNAYVLLPYGTYDYGINYDIYTDKGIAADRTFGASTGNHAVTLRAGRSAAMEDEVNYTLNNNSFEIPTTFDIASDQDWLDAVAYVTENYNSYGNTANWKTPTFKLLKDVKGALPNFAVDVETDNNTLTLTGSNTLNGTYAYDLTDANIKNEGQLTIAGTTTSSAKVFTVKSLTNTGTVTVNGKLTVTTDLTNTGTFTNAGVTTVSANVVNGNATSTPAAVLTNTRQITVTGTLTNCADATINVNNTAANTSFTVTGTTSNAEDAAINIADGAKLTASSAALTNEGTITLNGAAALDGGSTLDNEDGTIIITDAGEDYELTVPASGKAGVIKTTVATLAEIREAAAKTGQATADQLINRIELTNSINVATTLNLTTDVELCLAQGVNLAINNGQTVTCGGLVVSGSGTTVTAYSSTVENPTATLTAATVTVEQGAGFTVAEGVTVGSTVTDLTVGRNGSLTNNGTIAAAGASTTITVDVASGASLVNGEDGTVTGQFSISANAGQIVNQSETEITVAGSMVGTMTGAFDFN